MLVEGLRDVVNVAGQRVELLVCGGHVTRQKMDPSVTFMEGLCQVGVVTRAALAGGVLVGQKCCLMRQADFETGYFCLLFVDGDLLLG